MKTFAIALIPLVASAWQQTQTIVQPVSGYAAQASGAAKASSTKVAASAAAGAAVAAKDDNTWATQKSSSDFDSRWGKAYDSVEANSYDNEFFTRKTRADDDEWYVNYDENTSKDAGALTEAASVETKEQGIHRLAGYQPIKKGGFTFSQLVGAYTPEQKTVASHAQGYNAYNQGYAGQNAYGYQNNAYVSPKAGYGATATGYGYGNQGVYGQNAYGYGGRTTVATGYGKGGLYGGYGGYGGYGSGLRGYGGYGYGSGLGGYGGYGAGYGGVGYGNYGGYGAGYGSTGYG